MTAKRGRGRPPGSKNKIKAAIMPEETIKQLRAQLSDFQAKIINLEEVKKTSDGEKKAAAELIATLKEEIENIRAEMARLSAPPPPAPKASSGFLDDLLNLGE